MSESKGRDFDEDTRYRVANREAAIAVAYGVVYTAAVIVVALLTGYNKPADEVTFIWGFPAWFFWSGLITTLVFCIFPYFIVKYLYVDMPLSPDPASEREE